MSAHDCMGCGTEEPCQCPQDPLLEQVQRALRQLKIELLALRLAEIGRRGGERRAQMTRETRT